jgi:hypothetical protein
LLVFSCSVPSASFAACCSCFLCFFVLTTPSSRPDRLGLVLFEKAMRRAKPLGVSSAPYPSTWPVLRFLAFGAEPKVRDLPTGSDVAWRSGGRLNLLRSWSTVALVLRDRFNSDILVRVISIISALVFVRHCSFRECEVLVFERRAQPEVPTSLFEVAKLLQGSLQVWGGTKLCTSARRHVCIANSVLQFWRGTEGPIGRRPRHMYCPITRKSLQDTYDGDGEVGYLSASRAYSWYQRNQQRPRRQTVYASKDARIVENVIFIQMLPLRKGSTLPCVPRCHVLSSLSLRVVTSCVSLFARAGVSLPFPLVHAPAAPCGAQHQDGV